jgi:hypothetical protein
MVCEYCGKKLRNLNSTTKHYSEKHWKIIVESFLDTKGLSYEQVGLLGFVPLDGKYLCTLCNIGKSIMEYSFKIHLHRKHAVHVIKSQITDYP